MTTSLLRGKPVYCREWVYSKINHCLVNRTTAKTCGTLIMGGPGCGKTAVCSELVWPTSTNQDCRQIVLNRSLLAYYFCQAHDSETLEVSNFIRCISDQLINSSMLTGYRSMLENDTTLQLNLEPSRCEVDPDTAWKESVLVPLSLLEEPPQSLFIIIDSIDETSLPDVSNDSDDRTSDKIDPSRSASRSIAELLARYHTLFPPWLLLVCTSRRQSKLITRLFSGFRKIALDDLRKSHVVRDVQQYILSRLDTDERLRRHLSRDTADCLNQLHIKCNGCFLYLEKVLDGVVENFIRLREIRDIPGTLNGLYLWLCQRLFPRDSFSAVTPVVSVLLAARRPLTVQELYSCVLTRDFGLTYAEFLMSLDSLAQLLRTTQDDTRILFHHSFCEWLRDIKHCTRRYLCEIGEGHVMLAASFTHHALALNSAEVRDFARHLAHSRLGSPFMSHPHAALWLLMSGASAEQTLENSVGIYNDRPTVELLTTCGAELPEEWKLIGQNSAEEADEVLSKEQNGENDETVKRPVSLVTADDVDAVDVCGQTALSRAARAGDVEAVQELIQAGASVNHVDGDGWTVLRSAVWGGHCGVVSALLEAGVDVDHADCDGRTALRAAAWGGHEDVVTVLLQQGADVNLADKEGRTALIAAAYMGHGRIVEELLEYGASVDQEDVDGRTALSVAALCAPSADGHHSVITLLIDRGADVNHCDKDAMTPLLVAAYEGHHSVCEMLLEADADVDHADNNGRTALQAAASMGHQMVIALLLFWGAAVDMIDVDGRTVLSTAAQQGGVEIVRQLLNRGLDESHRDNSGWTPLHIAAFEGHVEVVAALLEAGARVCEVDNDNRIPFILAAHEGHAAVVETLAEFGSPVEARGHDGKTALQVAAIEGHENIVRFLLNMRANANTIDSDGRTPLYCVALDNQVSMALLLLEMGHADPDISDQDGRTALHVALWQGHVEMVSLLLSHGANPDKADTEGRTPIHSAAWTGQAAVTLELIRCGCSIDRACSQGATALCVASQEGHRDVVGVLLKHGANASHVDSSGRTPIKVATKGNHDDIVRMLRDAIVANGGSAAAAYDGKNKQNSYGHNDEALYANDIMIRRSNIVMGNNHTQPVCNMYENIAPKQLNRANNIVQSFGGEAGRRNLSQQNRTNTFSTNQSSSSSGFGLEERFPSSVTPSFSFAQQLQQCTGYSSASRRAGKQSGGGFPSFSDHVTSVQSPGSPLSEVLSCKASPAGVESPIYDSVCDDEIRMGPRGPEPVWQRQSVDPRRATRQKTTRGAMVMGQTALIMNSSPGGSRPKPSLPSNISRTDSSGLVTTVSSDNSEGMGGSCLVFPNPGEVVQNPGYAPSTPDATFGSMESLEEAFRAAAVQEKLDVRRGMNGNGRITKQAIGNAKRETPL